MKTPLLSVMQKRMSDGLTFHASETRQFVVVEPPSLPVRNDLFRYLADLMLVGAAAMALTLKPSVRHQHLPTLRPRPSRHERSRHGVSTRLGLRALAALALAALLGSGPRTAGLRPRAPRASLTDGRVSWPADLLTRRS